MKKPHVHAAAIHAFADGAQIQYFSSTHGKWVDTDCPSFVSGTQYRVKSKHQALIDAYDAGKTIQARLKSPSAQWHDQNRSKDLREHIESDLLDDCYDLRVKPAFPEIYDAYMAGKTIQAKLTDRQDKWDDEPRGNFLERILLGTDEPVQNVEMRVKPDTYIQHSRRYVYATLAGRENVALAYKEDPTDSRFVRWLDDDWLKTELEG